MVLDEARIRAQRSTSLACALSELGLAAEAERALERTRELAPDASYLRSDCALELLEHGRAPEALLAGITARGR